MANQVYKNNGNHKRLIGIMIAAFCMIVGCILCFVFIIFKGKSTLSGNSSKTDVAERQKAEKDFTDGELVDYQKAGFLKLGNYLGLEVSVEPTEEDIQYEIEALCTENAVKKGHIVKKGDTVLIDYVGSLDKEEFDSNEDITLRVGDYEYLEQFEDCMVGKEVGQTVRTNVKFPDDYDDKMLKGQTALFEIKIKGYVPAFNDEMVKKISKGKYKTVKEYQTKIKADLRDGNIESLGETVWEKLKEKAKAETVPEDLLAKAREDTTEMYKKFAQFQDVTVKELLASFDMTEDDVEDMAKDMAFDRMLARTIASIESLKLDDVFYKKKLAERIEIDENDIEKTSIEEMEEQYKESQSRHPREDVLVELVKEYIAGKAKMV